MTDKGQSTHKSVIHVFHFQHGEPMIPVPNLSAGMKVQLAFSIVTPHGLQAVRKKLSSVVRYQGKLTTTFRGEIKMCCAVPCRAVPCCAVLCCAVLCCAVLCCIVSIGLRCVASSNVTEESSWIIKTSKEPKKLFLICGFDDMTL